MAREIEFLCDWTDLKLMTYTREPERRNGMAPGRQKMKHCCKEGKWSQSRQDLLAGSAEQTGPVLGEQDTEVSFLLELIVHPGSWKGNGKNEGWTVRGGEHSWAELRESFASLRKDKGAGLPEVLENQRRGFFEEILFQLGPGS